MMANSKAISARCHCRRKWRFDTRYHEPSHVEADGTKISETAAISARATRHYKHHFEEIPNTEPLEGPFAISELDLAMILEQPQEDWEVGVNATDVVTAFQGCPKGKTAGRDLIPAEAWQAAIDAEPRLAAATAWAWIKRLKKWPEIEAATQTATNESNDEEGGDEPGERRHSSARAANDDGREFSDGRNSGTTSGGASTATAWAGAERRYGALGAMQPGPEESAAAAHRTREKVEH